MNIIINLKKLAYRVLHMLYAAPEQQLFHQGDGMEIIHQKEWVSICTLWNVFPKLPST